MLMAGTKTDLSAAPLCITDAGVCIVNFSSGHKFTFDDGTVLEACQDDRVHALALDRKDVSRDVTNNEGRLLWTDVEVDFRLSEEVVMELANLEERLHVNIILVPLPVVTALRKFYEENPQVIKFKKVRTIIRAARETTSGPGIICANKFGV